MTRKAFVIFTALSFLFSWTSPGSGQEGILRGPTPPLAINPPPPQPKPPAKPVPPSPPSAKAPAGTLPEKGVVNPRTGDFYPGTIGGVVNPQTGEVLPKVEGGYVNPKTGEVIPSQK